MWKTKAKKIIRFWRQYSSSSKGGLVLSNTNASSRDLTSSSQSSSSATTSRSHSSPGTPFSFDPVPSPKSEVPSSDSEKSHVLLDTKSMQTKVSGSDGFRVSVSSAQSSSSHGSAADDADALGDVYIWGEVICDNVVNVGIDKNASDGTATRTDVLVPKPLESNIVLDVHQIACGVRHATFVTRQGEIFTWGEESGGRLGHGIGRDVSHPRLVESLSAIDFVACGEFHTCAVTGSGTALISVTGYLRESLVLWKDSTWLRLLVDLGTPLL
ncbi:hypothetical protein F2Q70_00045572 [Brassica cretica]|uniref:Uncharacterized protein n=1 Tax=Brassica cretica TaxID=69181 RepID=A0A8S9KJR9_BRACR|nr:hypothetical protein F2Q70_00045572 [Brassica cretica]KAF3517069.1 hypothetical protein DY000_02064130 [Brassica cretica]